MRRADDPRATAPDLLRRALAALPPWARASGWVAMRADAGYFAGPRRPRRAHRLRYRRQANRAAVAAAGRHRRRRRARRDRDGTRPGRGHAGLPGLVAGEHPADPPRPPPDPAAPARTLSATRGAGPAAGTAPSPPDLHTKIIYGCRDQLTTLFAESVRASRWRDRIHRVMRCCLLVRWGDATPAFPVTVKSSGQNRTWKGASRAGTTWGAGLEAA